MLFSRTSSATVVEKRCAISESVSPRLTVYVSQQGLGSLAGTRMYSVSPAMMRFGLEISLSRASSETVVS